jgi:hypothetical protein
MEAREKRVAQSMAREQERFKEKATYLAVECQGSIAQLIIPQRPPRGTTKRGFQLCLLTVLRGTRGGAESSADATAGYTQQITCICSDHAQDVANLEEKCRKLIDDNLRLEGHAEGARRHTLHLLQQSIQTTHFPPEHISA